MYVPPSQRHTTLRDPSQPSTSTSTLNEHAVNDAKLQEIRTAASVERAERIHHAIDDTEAIFNSLNIVHSYLNIGQSACSRLLNVNTHIPYESSQVVNGKFNNLIVERMSEY